MMKKEKNSGILLILLILVVAAGSMVSAGYWQAAKSVEETNGLTGNPFSFGDDDHIPGGIFSHQLSVIMD